MARKSIRQIPVIDSAGRLIADKLGATFETVSEATGLLRRKPESNWAKIVRWAPGKTTLAKTAFIVFAIAVAFVIAGRIFKAFVQDHD